MTAVFFLTFQVKKHVVIVTLIQLWIFLLLEDFLDILIKLHLIQLVFSSDS